MQLREVKRKRRKAEQLRVRTKLTVHHQLYKDQCREVGHLRIKSKKRHCSYKIGKRGNSQKRLFKITKKPLGNDVEFILPSCSSGDSLANTFSDFFMRKTAEIRDSTIVMDADFAF